MTEIEGKVKAGEKTGIYTGEIGNNQRRKVNECEQEWNLDVEQGLGPYTFDGLLLRALESANKFGKHVVTVLDFGCGEAGLFRSYLNTLNQESKVMVFLKKHPEIRVKLIGITDKTGLKDLPNDISLNSCLPIAIPLELFPNFEANRIIYAVTAAQTLDKCLQIQGITDIDIALATHSTNYLSIQNFQRVLVTLAKHLTQQGGQLLISQYDSRVPGFRSAMVGAQLDVRTQKDSSSIPNVLRGQGRLYMPNLDITTEVKTTGDAISLYERLGAIINSDTRRNFSDAARASSSREAKLEVLKAVSASLKSAETRLFRIQEEKHKKGKRQVLLELKVKYPQLRFGDSVIDLKT